MNLFQELLNNMSMAETSEGCKIASLESLGYMCESMDPDTVDAKVTNSILSAIIDGMRADRSNPIKLAATTALNNSLVFSEQNFANQTERDTIMRSICEATQVNDVNIRARAFDCFATVADHYYGKLESYIETIFNLSGTVIKSDDHVVAMQAIEFWNVVCDVEINLKADNEGLAENEQEKVFNFMAVAAPTLIPMILEHMTRQEDFDDEDTSWNISTAAATLVESIALTIENDCIALILPFIQANISNTEWRMKEASIMAFGMILEGPDEATLQPYVTQALNFLVPAMADPQPLVRDTACWTIGRIFQFHKRAIPQEAFSPIVERLLAALDDKAPKVIVQTCFAVHNLAEACEDDSESQTNLLSFFLPQMLTKLFAVSTRQDWEVENIRESAFEAMDMMVANAAQDMISIITELLNEVCGRLEQSFTVAMEQVAMNIRLQMQSCLCILCNEIIKKLDLERVSQYADRIMQIVFNVLGIPNSPAHEDAMGIISSLAEKSGAHFIKYMPHMEGPLLPALRNVEDSQLVLVSLGVVGDICRAIDKELSTKHAPLCDEIVKILLMLLQNTTLKRSVKPQVISVFSDIAMAIEGEFERYFQYVIPYLREAGLYNEESDDEELIETMNALRDAILEAYTGIIIGLKSAKKATIVEGHLDAIIEFITRCVFDQRRTPDVLKSSIGLIGDLGQCFPQRMKPLFMDPNMNSLFEQAMSIGDTKAEEIVELTRDVQQQVLSGKLA